MELIPVRRTADFVAVDQHVGNKIQSAFVAGPEIA